MLRHLMEGYVRETQTRYGYQHVWTGHMVKEELYKKSGHLDHYSEVMFPAMDDEGTTLSAQADELPQPYDALQGQRAAKLSRSAPALCRVCHALPL